MILGTLSCRPLPTYRPLLTLSVKMTPNFQIWYLMSMDMSLCRVGGRRTARCLRVRTWPPPILPQAWGVVLTSSPGKQPRRWFRLALIMGCDFQCGQIHAQQFGKSLPPIDVPVLVQDLHRRAWGHADAAEVGEGHGQHSGFWGHSELCVRNWG